MSIFRCVSSFGEKVFKLDVVLSTPFLILGNRYWAGFEIEYPTMDSRPNKTLKKEGKTFK